MSKFLPHGKTQIEKRFLKKRPFNKYLNKLRKKGIKYKRKTVTLKRGSLIAKTPTIKYKVYQVVHKRKR